MKILEKRLTLFKKNYSCLKQIHMLYTKVYAFEAYEWNSLYNMSNQDTLLLNCLRHTSYSCVAIFTISCTDTVNLLLLQQLQRFPALHRWKLLAMHIPILVRHRCKRCLGWATHFPHCLGDAHLLLRLMSTLSAISQARLIINGLRGECDLILGSPCICNLFATAEHQVSSGLPSGWLIWSYNSRYRVSRLSNLTKYAPTLETSLFTDYNLRNWFIAGTRWCTLAGTTYNWPCRDFHFLLIAHSTRTPIVGLDNVWFREYTSSFSAWR